MMALTVTSSWLRVALSTVVGLVATPYLLRTLGPERYGLLRISEQWFAYIDFLNLGLGGAISVLIVRSATQQPT